MPLSMTGYGNVEVTKNDFTFIVNIKSLNSRYLDINLKLEGNKANWMSF